VPGGATSPQSWETELPLLLPSLDVPEKACTLGSPLPPLLPPLELPPLPGVLESATMGSLGPSKAWTCSSDQAAGRYELSAGRSTEVML
jgi:hypothetical protein